MVRMSYVGQAFHLDCCQGGGRGEGANKIIIFIFEGVLLLLQLVDAVENPVVDAKLPQLDSGRAREGGCE